MNLGEKLAAAYLRLNGFFLLPHFTVFSGAQHNHIDLIGLRAANSKEAAGGASFPVDTAFFNQLTDLRGSPSLTANIGVAAQIRTNDQRTAPNQAHLGYARDFMGGVEVSRLDFFAGDHSIRRNGECLDIGMRYAGLWIQQRIDWMIDQDLRLNKVKSWNWSESFLSDLLALRDFGLITRERNPTP
jgi:hypothetical protein